MLVCYKCREELKCIKNGIGARWGASHVYVGDVFKCRTCKSVILSTNANATYDNNMKIPSFQMREGYDDAGRIIEEDKENNDELEQLKLFIEDENE